MATEKEATGERIISATQPALASEATFQEDISSELEKSRRRKKFLPEKLRQLMSTEERFWSTGILSFIIPIPIFLMGFTIAYPSNATLDLTGEATELPEDYLLPQHLLSLFAVSC